MFDEYVTELPVKIYGSLKPYNDVISLARCRIFYKYANQNGTYITDDFAEKLISSLSYVPVKGIFSNNKDDFTEHGASNDLGKIYGVVPENHNFAWEKFQDEDGVEREYACCDVLLYTALYSEANIIIGSSQSMELYRPSLEYHIENFNGSNFIVFDKGCFLGLQVLGEGVQPCFEGAAFYSLQNSIKDICEQINKFTALCQNNNGGGLKQMTGINFKLSDNSVYTKIWSLLNTEYNEDNGWMQTYALTEIGDTMATAFNYETGSYEIIEFTKKEDGDIELNAKKKCYVLSVNEDEKATLDTLKVLNGDTYKQINDVLTSAKENFEKITELGFKLDELNGSFSTLKKERDDFQAQLNISQDTLSKANEELESLRSYKSQRETEEKNEVIKEYTNKLSKEILDSYSEKLDSYTAVDLDKELAYELKKSGFANFSKDESGFIPKDDSLGGIEEILSRHKQK